MKKIKTEELEKISGGVKCGTVGVMFVFSNAFSGSVAPFWNSLAGVCWDNYMVPVEPLEPIGIE